MGDTGRPPGAVLTTPPDEIQANLQTVTSKEGDRLDGPQKMRSFAQIIDDERKNRNIIEIKITKIFSVVDGVTCKPENLTIAQVGELMFDIIKIKPEDCAGVGLYSSRYDTKEVKLKVGVDPTQYYTITPLVFLDHEVEVKKQGGAVTRVFFRNVPFCIPDEEIINLCRCYGEPVNNKVTYDRPSKESRGVAGASRSVDMRMLPGKQFENFYWMDGPLEGDQGGRITVLHQHQVKQCNHCLMREDSCPAAGSGKLCKERGTKRGEISDYMRHLKLHHNYRSLKLQYEESEFPALSSHRSINDGFGHMMENDQEEEDGLITVRDSESDEMKEKIINLEKQLSESTVIRQQQTHEIATLKANAEKYNIDLNKSGKATVTISATNFIYDAEADALQVIDSGILDTELELYCTATTNRTGKIAQMRNKVLSQVKGMERKRRQRSSSVCSVDSISSGVGVRRPRSEDGEDKKDESLVKNPRLSQSQSLLPMKTK